jgi:hypothetical protein
MFATYAHFFLLIKGVEKSGFKLGGFTTNARFLNDAC